MTIDKIIRNYTRDVNEYVNNSYRYDPIFKEKKFNSLLQRKEKIFAYSNKK